MKKIKKSLLSIAAGVSTFMTFPALMSLSSCTDNNSSNKDCEIHFYSPHKNFSFYGERIVKKGTENYKFTLTPLENIFLQKLVIRNSEGKMMEKGVDYDWEWDSTSEYYVGVINKVEENLLMVPFAEGEETGDIYSLNDDTCYPGDSDRLLPPIDAYFNFIYVGSTPIANYDSIDIRYNTEAFPFLDGKIVIKNATDAIKIVNRQSTLSVGFIDSYDPSGETRLPKQLPVDVKFQYTSPDGTSTIETVTVTLSLANKQPGSNFVEAIIKNDTITDKASYGQFKVQLNDNHLLDIKSDIPVKIILKPYSTEEEVSVELEHDEVITKIDSASKKPSFFFKARPKDQSNAETKYRFYVIVEYYDGFQTQQIRCPDYFELTYTEDAALLFVDPVEAKNHVEYEDYDPNSDNIKQAIYHFKPSGFEQTDLEHLVVTIAADSNENKAWPSIIDMFSTQIAYDQSQGLINVTITTKNNGADNWCVNAIFDYKYNITIGIGEGSSPSTFTFKDFEWDSGATIKDQDLIRETDSKGDMYLKGIKSDIGEAKVLVLPSTINCISNDALEDNSVIQQVILDSSDIGRDRTKLYKIGNDAFAKCTNLKAPVKIPSTVNTLGTYSFSQANIPSLTFEDYGDRRSSLTYVPEKFCYNCSELSEINLPSSLTLIHDSAFGQLKNLKKINGFKDLNLQFTNCEKYRYQFQYSGSDQTSLEYVDGMPTTHYLPDYFMKGHSFLKGEYDESGSPTNKLTINSRIIGKQSLYGCTSLTTISLSPIVADIQSQAFGGCTSIDTIDLTHWTDTIPSSVGGGRDLDAFKDVKAEGKVIFSNYVKNWHEEEARKFVDLLKTKCKLPKNWQIEFQQPE